MSDSLHSRQFDKLLGLPRWSRWCAVGAWMVIIFAFSAQANSGDITEKYLGTFNYLVRKAAHMTEYAVLFALIRFALLEKGGAKALKTSLPALFLVAAYACTDEYHQLFVPGRSGQPKDVLFDTGGGFISLLVWHYLAALRSSWLKTRS